MSRSGMVRSPVSVNTAGLAVEADGGLSPRLWRGTWERMRTLLRQANPWHRIREPGTGSIRRSWARHRRGNLLYHPLWCEGAPRELTE